MYINEIKLYDFLNKIQHRFANKDQIYTAMSIIISQPKDWTISFSFYNYKHPV